MQQKHKQWPCVNYGAVGCGASRRAAHGLTQAAQRGPPHHIGNAMDPSSMPSSEWPAVLHSPELKQKARRSCAWPFAPFPPFLATPRPSLACVRAPADQDLPRAVRGRGRHWLRAAEDPGVLRL